MDRYVRCFAAQLNSAARLAVLAAVIPVAPGLAGQEAGSASPALDLVLRHELVSIPYEESKIADVAVSPSGRVYVLRSERTVDVFEGGNRVGTLEGRKVPRVRTIVNGPLLATDGGGRLAAVDRDLNAIVVHTDGDGWTDRRTIPFRFSPAYDFAVREDGGWALAAFADEHPRAQVHFLCSRVDCYEGGLGEPRAVRDSGAYRFFQSGFVALSGDTTFFARINPHELTAYEGDRLLWKTRRGMTYREGEADAFERRPDGGRSITNQFDQTTGLVLIPGRDVLVESAFYSGQGRSAVAAFSLDGTFLGKVAMTGFWSVEGATDEGDVVFLTRSTEQRVVTYRLESAW